MPLYETVLIARQDISASQVEQLADELANILGQGGGSVSKKEYWGLRNLSYRIKKNRKGHYVLLNVDAPAPAVHEMERLMRLNEDILRHMVVRVEELEEGPSAILQTRNERGDRDRGPRGGRGRDRGERGDRGDRGGDRGDRGERGERRTENRAEGA
ncbi:SSU ribosomal protein S6p [Caenispirillum salinarum AK4]|uniref:Small ribosomal subunit protein bS6 n=1 Tax=Caenispirillum salinarum AK4 TaxID=1238182 RepID=K9GZJ3_9PROT|nr:30S ribosomal protein S6 [Caenispirillum salinarum]EKV30159.1 SSU ribosomal protein S6p [Caenispirillum salinarum AK4]